MNEPVLRPFDLSDLPDRLRLNWHVYNCLRNGTREYYAKRCADFVSPSGPDGPEGALWESAWETACFEWDHLNPVPNESWSYVDLGLDAVEEAHVLWARHTSLRWLRQKHPMLALFFPQPEGRIVEKPEIEYVGLSAWQWAVCVLACVIAGVLTGYLVWGSLK